MDRRHGSPYPPHTCCLTRSPRLCLSRGSSGLVGQIDFLVYNLTNCQICRSQQMTLRHPACLRTGMHVSMHITDSLNIPCPLVHRSLKHSSKLPLCTASPLAAGCPVSTMVVSRWLPLSLSIQMEDFTEDYDDSSDEDQIQKSTISPQTAADDDGLDFDDTSWLLMPPSSTIINLVASGTKHNGE